jgi:hypothetical protein
LLRLFVTVSFEKGPHVFGAAASYLVAISAMLFSGLSALTLIYTVKHFDPSEAPSSPEPSQADEKVAG